MIWNVELETHPSGSWAGLHPLWEYHRRPYLRLFSANSGHRNHINKRTLAKSRGRRAIWLDWRSGAGLVCDQQLDTEEHHGLKQELRAALKVYCVTHLPFGTLSALSGPVGD